jgi:hypothetical protein
MRPIFDFILEEYRKSARTAPVSDEPPTTPALATRYRTIFGHDVSDTLGQFFADAAAADVDPSDLRPSASADISSDLPPAVAQQARATQLSELLSLALDSKVTTTATTATASPPLGPSADVSRTSAPLGPSADISRTSALLGPSVDVTNFSVPRGPSADDILEFFPQLRGRQPPLASQAADAVAPPSPTSVPTPILLKVESPKLESPDSVDEQAPPDTSALPAPAGVADVEAKSEGLVSLSDDNGDGVG